MRLQLIGNRYRIKGLIGEGGMASVYAAIDEKLDRRVAVKVLHSHLARNKDIRLRFHQEAKSISAIDHPNIIKVYDFSGNDSELLWIVTEILYGVDLGEYSQRFKGNRLHPIISVLVTREICNALEEVHQNHIVHRDIKPDNIFVLDSGIIKLMDFGIAKVASNQNATQTGTFMGSPSYMSPEQIRGVKVDVRSDIYSLNVLFYEILTGSLPYKGNTTADVINQIMSGTFVSPKEALRNIPREIDQLITKNLNKDPEGRHRNIVTYERELDDFLYRYGIKDSTRALREFFKDPKSFFQKVASAQTSGNSPRRSTIKTESRRTHSRSRSKTNVTLSKTQKREKTLQYDEPGRKQGRGIFGFLLSLVLAAGVIFVFALLIQQPGGRTKVPKNIKKLLEHRKDDNQKQRDPIDVAKQDKITPKEITPIIKDIDRKSTTASNKSEKQGPGILRISSNPAAEIYIDSHKFGTTNDRSVSRRGIILEPGTYTLTLKRDGWEQVSQKVRVKPEKTKSLNFTLKQKKQVTLKIQTNKRPTRIEIIDTTSGKVVEVLNLKKTRSRIKLPMGSYRIIATHGSNKKERVINLDGKTSSLSFNARFK